MDSRSLFISVISVAVPPKITTTSLPSGTVGKAYSYVLTATGTAPITWSIVGSLPPGLTLNPNTGLISGTPTTAKTYSFTVRATNIAGMDSKPLNISVISTAVPPKITTTSLPSGTVGKAYSYVLTATGTTPITWSIVGSLPPGLTLNPHTGMIYGTPKTANTYSFTVKATNIAGMDSKSLFISVISTAVPPKITTTSIPQGTVGNNYSYTLAATGTTPITWSIVGSLPPGLTLNPHTGLIYGTPTTANTYSFTVKATNSAGMDSKPLYISIIYSVIPPKITTTSLPPVAVGKTYSYVLNATGTTPISWMVVGGILPDGLTLNPSTGLISGTAKMQGMFNFTVRAMNSSGTDLKTLIIVVSVVSPPPNGYVGRPYEYKLVLPFNIIALPYIWSITVGSLPPGLTLSPIGGLICGTPTRAGTYNFAVQARFVAGGIIITDPLVIVINPASGMEENNALALLEDDEILQYVELDQSEDTSLLSDEDEAEYCSEVSESNVSGAIEKTGNNGNGCNAGYGYLTLALLGIVPFVLRKK
jgi:hypothetical protein